MNVEILFSIIFISGVTAFPLETEMRFIVSNMQALPVPVQNRLNTIYIALSATNRQYPFISYRTDWLAFAHIILAMLFIGPYRHPVKNMWVIQFSMIACLGILPLAFIAGGVRGIPIFWRFVDCMFGVICIIPLYIANKAILQLKALYLSKGLIVADV